MRFDMLTANVLFTAVYGVILLFLVKIFYSRTFSAKDIACFLTAFAIINGVGSHFARYLNPEFGFIKTIILFATSVFLLRYIINTEYKKSFILFGILVIILAVCEGISYLVLKNIEIFDLSNILFSSPNDFTAFVSSNLIICAMSFATLIILKYFKVYIYLPKNVKPIIISVATACIIVAVIMWFYIFNVGLETRAPAFVILIFLIAAYLIYMIYNINMSSKFERQKIELEQQKFYNKSLDKTLDNLRRFKHGYNNNLNVLYALAKMGKYDRLMEYFNEVMETNNKLNDTTALNIKNAGLYGVIASKVEYAESLEVKFKIDADSEVEDIKNIRMYDLYEIMGILLDNAIEAAAESNGKYVNLSIEENEEYIRILIKNTFSQAPDVAKIFEKGYSSKGQGRGMGLWIVKDRLKNNKFVLNNAHLEGKLFQQEIIIKKGF